MSTSSTSSVSSSTNQLGQNAFLQLLAVQMQNQDPLNPVDNTQFVAQLAQFSSLQELTTISAQLGSLSTTTSQMLSNQGTDQLFSAFNLLNSEVTLSSGTSSGTSVQVTGTVAGVNVSNGQVNIVVNGQSYSLSSIESVTATGATSTASGN